MKVSVVIPTFNRAAVIEECLQSVIAQTHRDLEVIVVDDGSTDDTARRVARFLHDPRVRYAFQPNHGAGAARNRGVQLSTASVISFLDSDDLWKLDKNATDVAFLLDEVEVDAVFSDVEKTQPDGSTSSLAREFRVFSQLLSDKRSTDRRLTFPQRTMYLCLLQELPVKTSTLSLRRAAFQSVGGFDTTIVSGQDWEFFLRLSKAHRFGYTDRPLAGYRTSTDSLHVLSGVRGLRAMWDVMKRERRTMRDDAEARAAAARGIVNRCKRVAWLHLARGERLSALKAYLDGYWDSGDAELLLRVLGCCLPGKWVRLARKWVPSTAFTSNRATDEPGRPRTRPP